MRNLWHWCARMHEAIELPFEVASRVGPKKGVLDGGPDPPWSRDSF